MFDGGGSRQLAKGKPCHNELNVKAIINRALEDIQPTSDLSKRIAILKW